MPELSSLTTALFLICLARLANSRVDRVSPMLTAEGDTLAMMTVLLLPPSESRRMKVSLLSRYGMWRPLPSDYSTRELITFPRAERDLLIMPASFRRSPIAFVFLDLSEPARSMM